MASHINGATINVSGSPDIKYYVTYTASRSSNSTVNYNFTIKTYMVGSSQSWLGNGYKLTLYVTVNGVQKSVVLKENDASWSGGSSGGTLKSTKTLSLTCTSTSGNANQTVTFQVVNKGDLNGSAGEITTTNYYVTSPALLYTACTAPTTFTASSNNFESDVTLSWSGAKSGTNNSIKYYYIQYAVSSDNSTWGSWTGLKSLASTSTSGSYTVNMSSNISRGYYVKFRIRTEGSAGSSYYSGYKTSSSIRRNPYTQCTAPTAFTITTDMDTTSQFDINVTLNWSGASNGSNNAISGYLIRYRISSDKTIWTTWTDLKTSATTKTSGSVTVDLSTVMRKNYVEFAIRTQGNAGSNYYSDWKYYQTSLQRNPYGKCVAPTNITISSEADVDGVKHNDIFNNQITIGWSGAKKGDNNDIKSYLIQYRTSSNNSTWSGYQDLTTVTSTSTSGSTTINISSKVTRGYYVQFAIKTVGNISGYDSAWAYSTTPKRNSLPSTPISFKVSSPVSLEYSNGDDIMLSWGASTDTDNNLKYYQLQACVTTNGTWGDWIEIDPIVSKSLVAYAIPSNQSLFTLIKNNECVQFRIRAYDIFGEVSSYVTSQTVTRYDITGVSIGINGKWVNCQIYVGTNGTWVEQEVSAGISNAWVDADDGT